MWTYPGISIWIECCCNTKDIQNIQKKIYVKRFIQRKIWFQGWGQLIYMASSSIVHFHIGIIFYCIGNSKWCIYNTQSKSYWLFNTQSRLLQADWLILGNNEKATLNINMQYRNSSCSCSSLNNIACRCWIILAKTRWGYMLVILQSLIIIQNIYLHPGNLPHSYRQ